MAESYQYRATYFGPRKVPAEVVAGELERIRAEGGLTANRVVEAARPATAKLHENFEWRDKEAAEEYRLIQARQLMRAIVVIREEGGVKRLPESVFVHVPSATRTEGEYVRLEAVTRDEGEYERALAEARRYLDAAEQRFHELRRQAEGKGDKVEALAIAAGGFAAVREALAILRAA